MIKARTNAGNAAMNMAKRSTARSFVVLRFIPAYRPSLFPMKNESVMDEITRNNVQGSASTRIVATGTG
jgi:hypothetical protein